MTGNLGNSTGSIKRETAGHLDLLKQQNEKLKRDLDDLKCRSMRDNLMFFGLAEISNENSFTPITEFCSDMLDIHDIRGYMDRSHRVGKFDRNKRRPIVVKFNNFNAREEIRRASYNLRGTRFSIAEQFPREINERRKELQPIMNAAKQQGKRVRLVRDVLYIDGHKYTGNEADPGVRGNDQSEPDQLDGAVGH
ncbi:hypothetical protein FSP39_002403 [Pinctada imbricata]|uniref:Endonuclease-reverse transcriptase n=1 Tax=Pinctada imbricata TaxID=66713 RepID=A0AA88XEF4_PINIB|nr:hypothetical protein FSP39_002403 [Pinctada imbricata]